MTLNIVHKNSVANTGGSADAPAPSDLELGEIAVNYAAADPALFAKDSSNNVVRLNEGPETVTTSKIAGSAVTSAKIASNAVTNGKMANDSVRTAEIQDDAVTTAKIADDAVTPAKLSETYRLATSGNILQVVSAVSTTRVTSTDENNYTDTTLTASITPTSSSSKILVLINQSFYNFNTGTYAYNGLKVLRDSTTIYTPNEGAPGGIQGAFDFGNAAAGNGANGYGAYGRASITLFDSPNTASSVTYKTTGRPYGVSTVVYQHAGNGLGGNESTITLMEVAA